MNIFSHFLPFLQTAGNLWNYQESDDGRRYEVRGGEVAGADRDRAETGTVPRWVAGQEIHLSYDMTIEGGESNAASWLVLGQWQTTPDPGEVAWSPPLAVELKGEQMRIMVRSSTDQTTTSNPVGTYIYADSADIVRDHAYHMEFFITFDPFGNGHVEVIRDGVVLVDYHGAVGYNDQQGHVWKEGIYRSATDQTLAVDYANLSIEYTHANPDPSLSYTGTGGNDKIWGGGGSDVLSGGAGSDQLFGSDGNDTLNGGDGADFLHGMAGADTIDGGAGTDTASYELSEAGVSVDLALGRGSGGDAEGDTLVSIEALTGSDFDDVLKGDDGGNALRGGRGGDVLQGRGGADYLDGGEGFDTASYADSAAGVSVSLRTGAATGGDAQGDTLVGIEALMGSAFNDTLEGNDAVNILGGGDGSDTLLGGGGNDLLDGGAGDDSLTGGAGDDLILGGAGTDTCWFAAAYADCTISYDEAGGYLVIGSLLDGTDWIKEIESFGFGGIVRQLWQVMADLTITTASSYDLAANAHVAQLTLVGADAVNGYGNGLDNIIRGNDNENVLDGRAGHDTLIGGGGNDTYVLGADADAVVESAGGGWDTIVSSVSRDLNDYAFVENLTLTGTANIDATGNVWANTLIGNDGDNVLDGGAGADTLMGGLGNDTYVLMGATNDTVIDTGGIDTIVTTIGRDLRDYRDIENATLLMSANAALIGNDLDNVLTGNVGANILDGGAGHDILAGGLGNDTYVLGDEYDTVIDTGGNDTITSTISRDLGDYPEIENLVLLGTANLNGTGNNHNNVITGNDGDNVLDGGGGDDRLVGGLGNDTYALGSGNDTVYDVGGIDTITSTITRDLRNYAGVENLTLTFSAWVDAIGDAYANVLTGNSGRNTLWGLEGDDVLYGMAGEDVLHGGSGNDVLDGGDGSDTLYGGLGNDIYVLGGGFDAVVDDGGWDTITSTISRNLNDYATVENLTLLGSANINATGNAWSNTIIGNDGDNVIDGGAGADTLMGGLGNDTYVLGAATNDTIVDIGGNDTITSTVSRDLKDFAGIENITLTYSAHVDATGGAGTNILTGNAGNNVLDGMAGNDVLDGGNGHDTLIGGLGRDVMTGGAGMDVFLFRSAAESVPGTGTRDVVTDFAQGQDRLDFRAIDAVAGSTGDAFSLLAGDGDAFTHAAGEMRWFTQDQPGSANDVTIVEFDSNGDGIADLQLQLNGLFHLTASDFIL